MTTTVGTHEAKTHLSEYLNRVAYRGERIVVERHGKPVAALVSMDDLRHLEQPVATSDAASVQADRQARFRRLAEAAGVSIQYPSEPPTPLDKRRYFRVDGPPVSEQIIADQR